MSSVSASITTTPNETSLLGDQTVEPSRCILFFDGVCGLCSKSVDFVMERDKEGNFQFAPLQGETARQLLPKEYIEDLNSMVVLIDGVPFRKSSAVVRILWHLGILWRAIGTFFWLIPLPVRDFGYSVIARNRYRFFGKHDACRMPKPNERARFLP